jgi:hypothetical protein
VRRPEGADAKSKGVNWKALGQSWREWSEGRAQSVMEGAGTGPGASGGTSGAPEGDGSGGWSEGSRREWERRAIWRRGRGGGTSRGERSQRAMDELERSGGSCSEI